MGYIQGELTLHKFIGIKNEGATWHDGSSKIYRDGDDYVMVSWASRKTIPVRGLTHEMLERHWSAFVRLEDGKSMDVIVARANARAAREKGR